MTVISFNVAVRPPWFVNGDQRSWPLNHSAS